MAKEVARSVDELNLPNTKVEQGEFLTVKGSKTVNDNSLQFDVNQNPTLVNNTAEFIRIIKAGEKIPELSLVALNDCIMSLKDFSVLDIDGSSYLVFDGKDKDHDFSYITGNIAPGLNLQVQTSGPGHEKAARDFVKSLRAELHRFVIYFPPSHPALGQRGRRGGWARTGQARRGVGGESGSGSWY